MIKPIQTEYKGGIPLYILPEVASAYGIGEGFLKAIIQRIPSLRIQNHHLLEICRGPNCGKHTQISQFAENYLKSHPNITIRFVPCMRMCGKGPNLKWDGQLHNRADETLLLRLLEEK